MSHVRTQIRDAFASALASVCTVYKSRVYPVADTVLPVILVYTNNEEINEDGSFSVLSRSLTVVVEIVADGGTSLDSTLDALTASAESAIGADPTLGGKCVEALPASIEIQISTEGARQIGRARLSYSVHYRTTAADPQTSI